MTQFLLQLLEAALIKKKKKERKKVTLHSLFVLRGLCKFFFFLDFFLPFVVL